MPVRKRARNSRRIGVWQWSVPLVLAMLCLRALVPSGFMLAATQGRLSVVLCDSGSAHHSRGGHEHPGMPHGGSDGTCPFAQSSGPAPVPALAVYGLETIVLVSRLPALAVEQTCLGCGPTRAQTSRGPPRFI